MDELRYPPCLAELDLDGGNGIKPEHIASYAWPPGRRQRYTDAGWERAKTLGIAELSVEDFGAVGDSTLNTSHG
jgi:hypothetical protein